MFEYEFKANKRVNPFDIHGLSVALGINCLYQKDDYTVAVRATHCNINQPIQTHSNTFTYTKHTTIEKMEGSVFMLSMAKQQRMRNGGKRDVISDYKEDCYYIVKYLSKYGINDVNLLSVVPMDSFDNMHKDFYISGAFTLIFTANISKESLQFLLTNNIGQKKSYGFGALRIIK